MFCVVEDAGGRAGEQEHMVDTGVDRGDDVVVR